MIAPVPSTWALPGGQTDERSAPAWRRWLAAMSDQANGSVRLSLGTLRFLVEIGLILIALSGWGWTIKGDVSALAINQQAFIAAQTKVNEEHARQLAMIRVQNEEIRVALAEKGIIVRRTP